MACQHDVVHELDTAAEATRSVDSLRHGPRVFVASSVMRTMPTLQQKNAISSVAALTQTCCEQSGRATARDNTRLSSMVALVAIVNSACQHPSGVPSMMQRTGWPSWGNNSWREGLAHARGTRVRAAGPWHISQIRASVLESGGNQL